MGMGVYFTPHVPKGGPRKSMPGHLGSILCLRSGTFPWHHQPTSKMDICVWILFSGGTPSTHSRCLINCCRITEQMPQRMVPAHSHWSFPKAWGPFPSCPRTCPFGLAALLTLVADLSINVVGKAAVEDLIPTTCLGSGEQTIALLPSFLPRKDCEWPGGSSQMWFHWRFLDWVFIALLEMMVIIVTNIIMPGKPACKHRQLHCLQT